MLTRYVINKFSYKISIPSFTSLYWITPVWLSQVVVTLPRLQQTTLPRPTPITAQPVATEPSTLSSGHRENKTQGTTKFSPTVGEMTVAHHDPIHHKDEVSKLSSSVNFICCLPIPLLCQGKIFLTLMLDLIGDTFRNHLTGLLGWRKKLK